MQINHRLFQFYTVICSESKRCILKLRHLNWQLVTGIYFMNMLVPGTKKVGNPWLRRHSAPAYQQWRTMMTARSGRGWVETLLSINNHGRGVCFIDITKTNGSVWGRGKHKEIKTKTLDGFLSLYDGCVTANTHFRTVNL